MGEDLKAQLVALVRQSPRLMTVLEAVREQALPEPLVFSGAIYQTVWNDLTGRPLCYGIKDYDVGYFDRDMTVTAEDRVIRRMEAALEARLPGLVQVRNQARVHLWFPEKFGSPYQPLNSTGEALQRFVCPAFAVGARLESNDTITVVAPLGLEDVFDMRLRVNPIRGVAADWDQIIASVVSRWPELVVEPPPQR